MIQKHEDFGKKIGGAKKDLWKSRGLIYSDILEQDFNAAEIIKYCVKNNIWLKPDYVKMCNEGVPVLVAFFIKRVRDAVPTSPSFLRGSSIDEIKEEANSYIFFVNKLKEYMYSLKTEEDVKVAYRSISGEISSHKYFNYDIANALNDGYYRQNWLKRKIVDTGFGYKPSEKAYAKRRAKLEVLYYDGENISATDGSSKTGRKSVMLKIRTSEYTASCYFYNDGWNEISDWEKGYLILDMSVRRIIEKNIESEEIANQKIEEIARAAQETENEKNTNRKSKKFKPEQLKHLDRNGENFRHGKSVTGDMVLDVFGFAGGEYGNWLNEKDRLWSLDMAFDAFADLSKALNVKATDLSLGNSLSIAFGARGSGKALAHYEPMRKVINLTKLRGGGSLAHEFGHALDNYLASISKINNSFASDSPRRIGKSFSELIDTIKYVSGSEEDAKKNAEAEEKRSVKNFNYFVDSLFYSDTFNKYRDSINEIKKDIAENMLNKSENYKFSAKIDELHQIYKIATGRKLNKKQADELYMYACLIYKRPIVIPKEKSNFYKNSELFDKEYSKEAHGYWASTVELFARAFACYIKDKLSAAGFKNDYLCGHADTCVMYYEGKLIKAYPEGEERENINKYFDKVFDDLRKNSIFSEFVGIEHKDLKEYEFSDTEDKLEDVSDANTNYKQLSLFDFLAL